MNKLDPELKQLLKWAGEASPSDPEEAPFGFYTRVLASRKLENAPTLLQELQRVAWGLSWASLALMVCAGLVLISQSSSPSATEGFSSALSFLVSNFAR
jgi:hypothetical protein